MQFEQPEKPFVALFFIECKKIHIRDSVEKRLEKRARNYGQFNIRVLFYNSAQNRNRHGDISHCGKSHDGYMLDFFGQCVLETDALARIVVEILFVDSE